MEDKTYIALGWGVRRGGQLLLRACGCYSARAVEAEARVAASVVVAARLLILATSSTPALCSCWARCCVPPSARRAQKLCISCFERRNYASYAEII